MLVHRQPRLFLSRASKGLGPVANRVAAVLMERGFDIFHQPAFGIDWRKIRHMLMDRIRESDGVVCLVGPAYGLAPGHPVPELCESETGAAEFSYAQIEYLIARRLHKPTLTILLADGFPLAPFEQTKAEERLQVEFIRKFVQNDEHAFQRYATEAALLDALKTATLPLSTALLPQLGPENIPRRSLGRIFTGRDAALSRLHEYLATRTDPDGAIVVIHGMGGVGKTRVALEFAHAHATDYSARLFLVGSSPEALTDSLANLCGFFVLNLEEQDDLDTNVRVDAVVRWLRTHPHYLLVIDSVDTEEARDAVVLLTQRLPQGHIVITTRIHTWPGSISRLSLDVLSKHDGARLLLNYRAAPKAPSDDDEVTAVALAQDLDGLPLALEQAAAYLNTVACTIVDYRERWKRNLDRVHDWHDAARMEYAATVATTWLTTFEQLYSPSQHLLGLLAWFAPEPVPRGIFATFDATRPALDPLSGTDVRKAFGELLNFSLVNLVLGGRAFALHRLVQQVTRERQPVPPTPPALSEALRCIDAAFVGNPDDVRSWYVLDALAPHALSVCNFAAEHPLARLTGRLLNSLALLAKNKGRHAAAEPLMRRALAIFERNHDPHHPNVAAQLNDLALLLHDTNRAQDAEQLLRRALASDEATFGANHATVAKRLHNLGALLAETGRVTEAEPLMRRALAIDEAQSLGDTPEMARGLHNLAGLLVKTYRPAAAEPLLQRALLMEERLKGRDHPHVALQLNTLASLYEETERISDAEPLLRRALEIMTSSYGEDHPAVAEQLDSLARLMEQLDRWVEAESLLRRSLSLDERNVGSDTPAVAARLINLAMLLMNTGRQIECESLLNRALAVDESAADNSSGNLASALSNLAVWYRSRAQIEDAERMVRRALRLDETTFGSGHPKVAIRLNNLAAIVYELGRAEEAEELLRRALQIDEATLGSEHTKVARRLNNLAQLALARGRHAEAERLLRRAIAIYLAVVKAGGSVPDGLRPTLQSYRALLLESGNVEVAARQTAAVLQDAGLDRATMSRIIHEVFSA
jgi:tetratricopeptide (TPR) repeat protein